MLGHHGVALLVVTPPPKARVYPEYVEPYLVAPAETIVSQAISYGDVLEQSGVNALNIQRIFAQRKAGSSWPFFTTTSFHWSYWAGCMMTDEIMRKAEALTGSPFFSIDSIIGYAPFPKIIPQQGPGEESRKITIIGDSFSDQIVSALAQALPENMWSPGWLTRYDSFISRQTIGIGGKVTAQAPLKQDKALSEILTKELLVMEVSDGHVYRDAADLKRMEFGATQVLLDGLLTKTDAGMVDPKRFLVQGWRDLGNKQWRTTGHKASFAIRPPTNGNRIQLTLDVENLSPDQSIPRRLDILVDGKSIGQATLAQGRGMLELTVPSTFQWQDDLVTEISLQDASGQPLAMLLHGVQMLGADTDKAANKRISIEVLPSAQILDQAGIRTVNLINSEEPEDVLVDGLSSLESSDKESWRWALGPATRIKFYIDPAWPEQARQLLLKFAFKNGVPIPDQTVTIRLNGKDIRHFSSEEIGIQKQVDADMALTAKQGLNVLEIVYQDWNHGKKNYGSNDPRQLAVVVMHLSLQGANKVK
ncbi:MAG: hypothetical protein K9L79_11775 [Methylobacter tundripaludum]|nr:hypothetical protein [Methylobacter tundripaludum]